jgi:hypothetical protein
MDELYNNQRGLQIPLASLYGEMRRAGQIPLASLYSENEAGGTNPARFPVWRK